MKTTRGRLLKLAVATVALGFINFLAFWIESLVLGGDALNGYAKDGQFFLGSHGAYTEVAQAVWIASLIHGIVTFASWPFVILAMAFLVFRYILPSKMAGRVVGNAGARADAIRASGEPIWSGWPGGMAGGVRASIGMLGATVYPGGIVANVRIMRSLAIRAAEIHSVRFGRQLLWPTVEVEHDGIDVASPLVLYGRRASPQAAAISALVRDRQLHSAPTEPALSETHAPEFGALAARPQLEPAMPRWSCACSSSSAC
jgi:hypothetical protein